MHTVRSGRDRTRVKRVLAYCHDGVGLGHLRRTLNICERVGAAHQDASFLIVTGSPFTGLFASVPRVDFVKLPSLRKIENDYYVSKYVPMSSREVLRYRSKLLLATTRLFDPDVVLVDKAPVGVCGELMPTLRWLRGQRPRTRLVFGMRDIEDETTATVSEWTRLGAVDALAGTYDEVWVYGVQDVFDVVREYSLPAAITDKLRYMGYVTRVDCGHPSLNGNGSRDVLITVGGGTDGDRLLEIYLARAAGQAAEAGFRSVIVGGPDLPPDKAAALRSIVGGVRAAKWIDFESCMLCRLRRSQLVVCMGGYNTLCEVVVSGRQALVVPRTAPRLEQTMRARLWSRLGLVQMLEPAQLSPDTLADCVGTMLQQRPDGAAGTLPLTGLDGVLERFNSFWRDEVRHAAALRV